MRDFTWQFDMAESLATRLARRYFDTAAIANHAALIRTLEFATSALQITERTEDPLVGERANALLPTARTRLEWELNRAEGAMRHFASRR